MNLLRACFNLQAANDLPGTRDTVSSKENVAKAIKYEPQPNEGQARTQRRQTVEPVAIECEQLLPRQPLPAEC